MRDEEGMEKAGGLGLQCGGNMPAPSPSVTFINKLPLLAFLLPVWWRGVRKEEGGGRGMEGGDGGAAVPSTTLSSPASTGLSVPWGFWFLGVKVSPDMESESGDL